jgi:hypothetical protein
MNQQIIQYQNQLRSHQAIRHNNIMRRIGHLINNNRTMRMNYMRNNLPRIRINPAMYFNRQNFIHRQNTSNRFIPQYHNNQSNQSNQSNHSNQSNQSNQNKYINHSNNQLVKSPLYHNRQLPKYQPPTKQTNIVRNVVRDSGFKINNYVYDGNDINVSIELFELMYFIENNKLDEFTEILNDI